MPTWTIALDVIEDVRGSVGMYLFIIEESIQTLGMACYLLAKEQRWNDLLDLANWIIANVINPAIDFCNNYGAIAYPLNMAYDTFYKASKTNMENYIKIAQSKLGAP